MSQSGQIKDNKIGICYFYGTQHLGVRDYVTLTVAIRVIPENDLYKV
jgi:ABC-type antimicrobial peptide transport system ATPase subunit